MNKIFLLYLIPIVFAGSWVQENATNCWGQVCRPTSLCWRPIDWDVPAVCLPAPVDPNVDWEYKVFDGNLSLIDVIFILFIFFWIIMKLHLEKYAIICLCRDFWSYSNSIVNCISYFVFQN